jgi:hypothetical protein
MRSPPKTPAHLQKGVDRILDESNHWEVETMIVNLEVTLEKARQ